MENKNYEEEYSVLEIAKYNLKKWPILLICALICGLIAGGYGFFHTEPSVVYYQNLDQVNGAYFISDYNGATITERMYDAKQMAYSHGAYEKFIENTGYTISYDDYQKMFGYSDIIVTSLLNMFVGYPETYGDIELKNEEDALTLMQQLMDAQMEIYNKYVGEGNITILSAPYTTSYTQAAAETASTPKDLVMATAKGGIAGIFLGLLVGIIVVSSVYLVGTVAKTAKEIEEKLKAPAVAFVHKDDREEEFKKVSMFLEQKMGDAETICYVPYHEEHADGAYDVARAFARMNQKTLYVNLSVNASENANSLSDCLFGKCKKDEVKVTRSADGVDVINRNLKSEDGKELLSARGLAEYLAGTKESYERVIVNAPDVKISSDAYGIAAYCDKVLFGCKRREVTGTDLYEISNTMENNGLTIDGVVVYGN